jgi:hypothetical protein
VQPDRHVRPEFLAAFRELAGRIARTLTQVPKRALPIKMYVAGGAALHLYTGERLSNDIDASFSHRIALPDDLEVSYVGPDGNAQLLFFDRQYNDTLWGCCMKMPTTIHYRCSSTASMQLCSMCVCSRRSIWR